MFETRDTRSGGLNSLSLTDPVGLLVWLLIVGGVAGIGLHAMGFLPLTGTLGGAWMLVMAAGCVQRSDDFFWRKQRVPLVVIAFVGYVALMVMSVTN